jgi:hypothetical protein
VPAHPTPQLLHSHAAATNSSNTGIDAVSSACGGGRLQRAAPARRAVTSLCLRLRSADPSHSRRWACAADRSSSRHSSSSGGGRGRAARSGTSSFRSDCSGRGGGGGERDDDGGQAQAEAGGSSSRSSGRRGGQKEALLGPKVRGPIDWCRNMDRPI